MIFQINLRSGQKQLPASAGIFDVGPADFPIRKFDPGNKPVLPLYELGLYDLLVFHSFLSFSPASPSCPLTGIAANKRSRATGRCAGAAAPDRTYTAVSPVGLPYRLTVAIKTQLTRQGQPRLYRPARIDQDSAGPSVPKSTTTFSRSSALSTSYILYFSKWNAFAMKFVGKDSTAVFICRTQPL